LFHKSHSSSSAIDSAIADCLIQEIRDALEAFKAAVEAGENDRV